MTQYMYSPRFLAELDAIDELVPLKLLEMERQAGTLTNNDVIELREAMKRVAVDRNICMERGLSGWFMLSFSDLDAEPSEQFLGVVIIWALDAEDAAETAPRIDVHPGGEVHARQLPRRAVPDESWHDRLLSAEDLAAVATTLNARPRKTLGWRTPAEALDELLRSAQASVATTP